jgi:uncharacterized protein (TIGR00255 family)
MTGFGKSTFTYENKTYNIEIRTLNSKQADINIRVPQLLKEKESHIKRILTDELLRGKIDFNLNYELLNGEIGNSLNKEAIKSYLSQLESALEGSSLKVDEMALQSILRMPEVLVPEKEEFTKEEWEVGAENVKKACQNLSDFRRDEGEVLRKDLLQRVERIEKLLKDVVIPEETRIERVKDRIKKNLLDAIEQDKIDENRFEQELIYYLEKYDITEEKIRLQTHCKYFVESMNLDGVVGKKLNFISQEMGREINTLGSKANDADLQRIVVEMKDELEKIKEQAFNIL